VLESYETITTSEDGGVVTVTLSRPEVHNAFNVDMIRELIEAFRALAANDEVQIVILRGAGRSFCAGADVNWMRKSLDLSEAENIDDARQMSDMFAAINSAPQAVIGRVHGSALGGGMGLIAVCDIVLASDSAGFGFSETRLGIIPAVISRFVVPKIGASWARRLFLSGERFSVDRAVQIGLVHDVAPESELDDLVDGIVSQLREAGPIAIREAKALIEGVSSCPRTEWRDYTASQIARVRTSPEGQEGLRAFLERRKPNWKPGDDANR
jgi:methylglutaconyl-CoA hydratase